MRVLLFVFVVFLVNLPYAHETWTDHRITAHGHEVVAEVLDARDLHGSYLVDYRLPAEEDPKRTKFSASVDEVTYEHARDSEVLAVRVLRGHPGENRPDGLVPSSLFTVVAVAGDAVLLLILALALYRRRHPGDMPDPRPKPVGLG
ncbi:MAG: hypothetical protein ACJ72E_00425 [Marmoricola sp.]